MRRFSLWAITVLFCGCFANAYGQEIGNTVRYSAIGTASIGDRADFLFEWGGAGIISTSGTTPVSFIPACSNGYAGLPTLYSQDFEISSSTQAIVVDMSYRLSVDPGKSASHGGGMVILIQLVDAKTEEILGRVGIEQKEVEAGKSCEFSSVRNLRIATEPNWFVSSNRKVKLRAVLDVAPVVKNSATLEEYHGRTAATIN